MMTLKPKPFGRYLLLDKVASGGMAEVWRGKLIGESGFERIVAITKILPHVSDNEQFITMFTDEAKITVQLQHSNIGQVYEFSKENGTYYIGMEYVSGKDLKTIWSYNRKRKKIVPVELACMIVQKMAEGLDYAHRKKSNLGKELGIVHRDVSPQNVIVSWEGEIKVIDFGIAKAADKSGKTRAGTLKGKFAYMSPEQIRGRPLDGRADIFSLGVCLYELVTGKRGFEADSEFALLEMVRDVQITPPTMINKSLPAEVEKIIFSALEKDRTRRYQYASELAEALQRFLLSRGSPPNRERLGEYLRQNFTVDYDEERLRLEAYKDVQWDDTQATTAQRSSPPNKTDSGPQRISDIQRALAEETAPLPLSKAAVLSDSGAFATTANTRKVESAPAKLARIVPSAQPAPNVAPQSTPKSAPDSPSKRSLLFAGLLGCALVAVVGAALFLIQKPSAGIVTITVSGPE